MASFDSKELYAYVYGYMFVCACLFQSRFHCWLGKAAKTWFPCCIQAHWISSFSSFCISLIILHHYYNGRKWWNSSLGGTPILVFILKKMWRFPIKFYFAPGRWNMWCWFKVVLSVKIHCTYNKNVNHVFLICHEAEEKMLMFVKQLILVEKKHVIKWISVINCVCFQRHFEKLAFAFPVH